MPALLKYTSFKLNSNNQKISDIEIETKIQAVALVANISTDSRILFISSFLISQNRIDNILLEME